MEANFFEVASFESESCEVAFFEIASFAAAFIEAVKSLGYRRSVWASGGAVTLSVDVSLWFPRLARLVAPKARTSRRAASSGRITRRESGTLTALSTPLRFRTQMATSVSSASTSSECWAHQQSLGRHFGLTSFRGDICSGHPPSNLHSLIQCSVSRLEAAQ